MSEKTSPGVIRQDEVYTVAEFCRRMDIGNTSWRAVRNGLKVIHVGKKRYVRGIDWIDYLDRIDEMFSA
jgi:hypothetical protein